MEKPNLSKEEQSKALDEQKENKEKAVLHPNEWRKQNGMESVYGVGLVDLYQQEKES